MHEREGLRIGRDQELARKAAVVKATAWTAEQAAGLQTSPEEILAAVRRGWLPEDIEAVTSRYALEDVPPSGLDGLRKNMANSHISRAA